MSAAPTLLPFVELRENRQRLEKQTFAFPLWNILEFAIEWQLPKNRATVADPQETCRHQNSLPDNGHSWPAHLDLFQLFIITKTESCWFKFLLAPRPGLEPGTCGLTVWLTNWFYWFLARPRSSRSANNRQKCHVAILQFLLLCVARRVNGVTIYWMSQVFGVSWTTLLRSRIGTTFNRISREKSTAV